MAKLAKAVGDDGLRSFAFKAVGRSKPGRLVSNLLYTIKTHKGKCDVSFRLIHSGALHPFAAGSGVLRQELKASLAPLGHLVRSTDELLQRLRSRKFPEGCQSVKLDIKDFHCLRFSRKGYLYSKLALQGV